MGCQAGTRRGCWRCSALHQWDGNQPETATNTRDLSSSKVVFPDCCRNAGRIRKFGRRRWPELESQRHRFHVRGRSPLRDTSLLIPPEVAGGSQQPLPSSGATNRGRRNASVSFRLRRKLLGKVGSAASRGGWIHPGEEPVNQRLRADPGPAAGVGFHVRGQT